MLIAPARFRRWRIHSLAIASFGTVRAFVSVRWRAAAIPRFAVSAAAMAVAKLASALQVAIAKAIVFAVTPARPRAPSFRGDSVASAVTVAARSAAVATAVVSQFAASACTMAVVHHATAITVAIAIAIAIVLSLARPRARSFRDGSVAFALTAEHLAAAIATAAVPGVAATATTAAATAVRVVAAIGVLAHNRQPLVDEHRDALG